MQQPRRPRLLCWAARRRGDTGSRSRGHSRVPRSPLPPKEALTPRPRGNKPRGGARSGLPPFSPPSPGLEQRGSPGGASAGVPGVDTSRPPRSPPMLPMPSRSTDPHDKPLAAPFPPNHPPCLSESLSLDCPRPSGCGPSAPAQDLLLIRTGARPYRPTEGFAFSRLPTATRAIGLSTLGPGGGCGGRPNGRLRPAPS